MADNLLNIKPQIFHKFKSFYYDTLNNFVYVGDDYGILYTFDVKNGYMSSAIIAHNHEITQIGFIDSLNCIVTQSLEEMRFWRVGAISEELNLEIRKVIEKDYYMHLKQSEKN
jgi:thiamine monophosphate kinase